MTTTRALSLLLPLAALAAIPFACTPSTSNVGPTCNNSIAGTPDGSIKVNCSWTGGDAGADLNNAFDHLVGDAGTCQQDSDCVFLTDGGEFIYGGYHAFYVGPVALQNVEGFLEAAESMICGFDHDAGTVIDHGSPSRTPQSDFCLVCYKVDGGPTGQCVPNPIMDGGT